MCLSRCYRIRPTLGLLRKSTSFASRHWRRRIRIYFITLLTARLGKYREANNVSDSDDASVDLGMTIGSLASGLRMLCDSPLILGTPVTFRRLYYAFSTANAAEWKFGNTNTFCEECPVTLWSYTSLPVSPQSSWPAVLLPPLT